jgi:hypothetical protein
MKKSYSTYKVYKSLTKDAKRVEDIETRYLLLDIMCLAHVDDLNELHIVGTTVTSIATSIFFMVKTIPMALAMFVGSLSGYAYVQLKNSILQEVEKVMTDELLGRFDNPQDAYLQVSDMIKSISRDEIIMHLNMLSK